MVSKDAAQLAVECEQIDTRRRVIVAHGQIDLYSAPTFKETVLDAIDDGATHLVIDLSDVDFMDSTGLGVLVGASKRLAPMDGSIRIVSPDDLIRRLFEISGLQQRFPVFESRELATALL